VKGIGSTSYGTHQLGCFAFARNDDKKTGDPKAARLKFCL